MVIKLHEKNSNEPILINAEDIYWIQIFNNHVLVTCYDGRDIGV